MMNGSYHKTFISYLLALSLIWSLGFLFLIKKGQQFGCRTLFRCLVYEATPDNILEVNNKKIDTVSKKNDEKKKLDQATKDIGSVSIIPESGTLLLYDQSTQFAITVVNEGSMQKEIDFFLADQLIKSVILENAEKKVLNFKIHPFENRLSWKIKDDDKETIDGFVDVLKMDSKLLKEAISNNRKMMVLE